MHSQSIPSRRSWLGEVTRRDLLLGGAALAASRPMSGLAQRGKATSLAYVGCYTPNGSGIYLFRVEANGELTQIKVFTTPNPSPSSVSATNPSWIAFDSSKTHLYAANEIGNFNNTTSGAVSAFAVNQANGDLTFLNTVSSQGSGPAHLSVDRSGSTFWSPITAVGTARSFPSSAAARSGRRPMYRPMSIPAQPVRAL
jgi:6-phosphogluconolactonase